MKCNSVLVFAFLFVILIINGNAQEDHIESGLVNDQGIGDLGMVFKPGMKIGDIEIRKTFQPSFVVTSAGTLLVFCQGRLFAGADNDPKVILMNRSFDMGKTWEGVQVLSNPLNHFAISPWIQVLPDGKECISFLTCVGLRITRKFYDYDPDLLKKKTGIDLSVIGEDKAAVICRFYSVDDGETWNMETLTGDDTPLYKNYEGFTPVFMNIIGQVHKIPDGKFKDRLIIAIPVYAAAENEKLTNNFRNHPCVGSGIIYSDDGGAHWKMNGMIADYLANEASAVSTINGEDLLMIRRLNQANRLEENPLGLKIMAVTSNDGGKTWSDPDFVEISEILCHGTLARVGDRLYFSIPAGLEDKSKIKEHWDNDRIRGTIYYSDDGGNTWKHKMVEPAYFSYSTIGKLSEDHMITFFSRGGHGRFGIGYRIFTDQWLDSSD